MKYGKLIFLYYLDNIISELLIILIIYVIYFINVIYINIILVIDI